MTITSRSTGRPSRRPPVPSPQPATRQLTLTYSSYQHRRDGFWAGSRRFPVLRLGGVWLERAGFAPGQRVQVRVDAGRLVIEPAG